MAELIPVIGMEVHVQLKTKSKMFCGSPNDPDCDTPNKHICEVCLAHPGTLPVPNKEAIAMTAKIGKALGCTIRELSKFDRKHYFYPDLPKGYQISQYDEPIAEGGEMNLQFFLEENIRDEARIGITRVHLEEDTAKLSHDKKGNTLVDFNRAGVPLVEIVTDPDFMSAREAKKYCQELRLLFRYLGVSDADMEKGHMRCEANVSVQQAGQFEVSEGSVIPFGNYSLNPKVELKNINSFRAIEKAIEYEIDRQKSMIAKKETWVQQTRGWDENKGKTVLQREKENAQDYRYFPDPDIPPFHPPALSQGISLPELPQAKRKRFHEEYGFSYADAHILAADKSWAHFTDEVMSEVSEWLHSLPDTKKKSKQALVGQKQKLAKLVGGWLTSKLSGVLSDKGKEIRDISFTAENFAELIALIYSGRLNATNAQKILELMVESKTDLDPTHVMEEKGYGQISDERIVGKLVDAVIKDHPKQVEQFKAGKDVVLKFLIGMVMKASEGSADPEVAEKILREKL